MTGDEGKRTHISFGAHRAGGPPAFMWVTVEQLARHCAVAGATGGGKTMLLVSLMRQFAARGVGFTLITPHPGACDEVLRYCAAAGIDPGRVVYVKPGDPDHGVSFDPFADRPDRHSLVRDEAWLSATADRVLRAFLRDVPGADQEVMRRMKRWMENVLVACGVEAGGDYLGLDAAPLLLSPSRPEFERLLDRLGPDLRRLRPDVYDDFHKLRTTRGARQQEAWVESSIGLLRDALRPVTRLAFGRLAPSVSHRDLVLDSKIVLVDVSETEYLSRDQGRKFGGLWYQFLAGAARRIGQERPREDDRVWHAVLIDEFQNFVAEDTGDALGEMRKFRLIHAFAFQDLSCLEKGDVALVGKVVSQVGILASFAQNNPDDVELLAKAFKYGDLDLTPLLAEHALPADYEWVDTETVSHSTGTSRAITQSRALGRTEGRSSQTQTAESLQRSVSLALSAGTSAGETWGRADGGSIGTTSSTSVNRSSSTSDQRSTSEGKNRALTDGRTEPVYEGNPTESTSLSRASSESESRARSTTESYGLVEAESASEQQNWSNSRGGSRGTSQGTTLTLGGGAGRSESRGEGESSSTSEVNSTGTSEGESAGVSVTRGKAPLARHRFTIDPNGKTVVAAADQLYAVMNLLAAMPDRTVLCRVRGLKTPFLIGTHEVGDPFREAGRRCSEGWKDAETADFVRRVRTVHPFYFTPDEEARRARVDRFLYGDVPRDDPPADDVPRDHDPDDPPADDPFGL